MRSSPLLIGGLLLGCVGAARDLMAITAASYESAHYFLARVTPSTGAHTAVSNVTSKIGSNLLPCNLAVGPAVTIATLQSLPRLSRSGALISKIVPGTGFLPINMQRDHTAAVAVVDSYNMTTGQHAVHELGDDGSWALAGLINASIVVQVGISSYCEKGRVLFLTANDDDDDGGSGTSLLRFSVGTGLLLAAPVPMEDNPTAIAWDSSTATLYAWTGNETYPAMLVVVDVGTGRRVGEPVACFRDAALSFGATPLALDEAAQKLYTPLTTVTSPPRPLWSVVDLTTGSTDERLRPTVVLDLAWADSGQQTGH